MCVCIQVHRFNNDFTTELNSRNVFPCATHITQCQKNYSFLFFSFQESKKITIHYIWTRFIIEMHNRYQHKLILANIGLKMKYQLQTENWYLPMWYVAAYLNKYLTLARRRPVQCNMLPTNRGYVFSLYQWKLTKFTLVVVIVMTDSGRKLSH